MSAIDVPEHMCIYMSIQSLCCFPDSQGNVRVYTPQSLHRVVFVLWLYKVVNLSQGCTRFESFESLHKVVQGCHNLVEDLYEFATTLALVYPFLQNVGCGSQQASAGSQYRRHTADPAAH